LESDDGTSEDPCPDHVWFANQTAENACCTIALLNIVNNVSGVDLGEHLKSFKDFTQGFPPPLRGNAISNWRLLKSIHNSFARKMDMLKLDIATKKEVERWRRRKARAAKTTSKTSNERKNDALEFMDNEIYPVYHYVGFVPIKGELWRLDGMDKNPVNLGTISDGPI
jgi:ubiquitin carboxyl-terminal hydrolase L5